MKEHWKFLMAGTPQGYGPEVDGKPCYWFRLNHIGTGGTTLIIPRERYWPKLSGPGAVVHGTWEGHEVFACCCSECYAAWKTTTKAKRTT